MNVNCKVSLTDEQRNTFFRRLSGKDSKGMVSRADVNKFVNDRIEKFLNGVDPKPPLNGGTETGRFVPEPGTKPNVEQVDRFKPSRGDEEYIFKAKDESLREIHSRMLDDIEAMEAKVWEEMEKNRA